MYVHLERRSRQCWTTPSGRYYCESNWDRFGRWIVAGIFLFIFFVVLIFLVRKGKNRRRVAPTPYTSGWAGQQEGPTYQANNYDYNNGSNTGPTQFPAAPPPYQPGPDGVSYQQAPPQAHVLK